MYGGGEGNSTLKYDIAGMYEVSLVSIKMVITQNMNSISMQKLL